MTSHADQAALKEPGPWDKDYIGPHVRRLLRATKGRRRKNFAMEAVRAGEAPNPASAPRAIYFRALSDAADNRHFSPELTRLYVGHARRLRLRAPALLKALEATQHDR